MLLWKGGGKLSYCHYQASSARCAPRCMTTGSVIPSRQRLHWCKAAADDDAASPDETKAISRSSRQLMAALAAGAAAGAGGLAAHAAVGALHGEGFTRFLPGGPQRLDVEALNDQMRPAGALRLRHAQVHVASLPVPVHQIHSRYTAAWEGRGQSRHACLLACLLLEPPPSPPPPFAAPTRGIWNGVQFRWRGG